MKIPPSGQWSVTMDQPEEIKHISVDEYEKRIEKEMIFRNFVIELYKNIANTLELEYSIFPGIIPSMHIEKYDALITACYDNYIKIHIKSNSYIIEIDDNYCEHIRKIFEVSSFVEDNKYHDKIYVDNFCGHKDEEKPCKLSWWSKHKKSLINIGIIIALIIINTLIIVRI